MVQRYDLLSCFSSSLWGFTACLDVADAATDAAFLESVSRNAGRKIRLFYFTTK